VTDHRPYIPDDDGCFEILQRYETPEHIVAHSRKVWEVARVVAHGLERNDCPLDAQLLRAACLLHDVAKFVCIREGKGFHDVRGGEILESEGLPAVARIIVQHVFLHGGEDDPIREEHVLYYADKRVVHDRVATIEERFDYLASTYGGACRNLDAFEAMKLRTIRLETRLFSHLDFMPDDIPGLMENHGIIR
jgi:uncharacterized protein